MLELLAAILVASAPQTPPPSPREYHPASVSEVRARYTCPGARGPVQLSYNARSWSSGRRGGIEVAAVRGMGVPLHRGALNQLNERLDDIRELGSVQVQCWGPASFAIVVDGSDERGIPVRVVGYVASGMLSFQ